MGLFPIIDYGSWKKEYNRGEKDKTTFFVQADNHCKDQRPECVHIRIGWCRYWNPLKWTAWGNYINECIKNKEEPVGSWDIKKNLGFEEPEVQVFSDEVKSSHSYFDSINLSDLKELRGAIDNIIDKIENKTGRDTREKRVDQEDRTKEVT